MKKRIKRRIEDLRQQPESVRYRAVSYFTAVAGALLLILWLTAFLPVQLYLQNQDESDDGRPGVFTQLRESLKEPGVASPAPQVGGIQDAGTPSPTVSNTPLPTSY